MTSSPSVSLPQNKEWWADVLSWVPFHIPNTLNHTPTAYTSQSMDRRLHHYIDPDSKGWCKQRGPAMLSGRSFVLSTPSHLPRTATSCGHGSCYVSVVCAFPFDLDDLCKFKYSPQQLDVQSNSPHEKVNIGQP
jgi:hypothetical protein